MGLDLQYYATGSDTPQRVDENHPLPAQLYLYAGGTRQVGGHSVPGSDNVADGTWGIDTNTNMYAFNGAGMDRVRSNVKGTLLASASRTGTLSSADQVNYSGAGLHVVLDVTAAGTGSITLSIEAKDPVSGNYYTLLTGAAVVTAVRNVYKVVPGGTVAANVSVSDLLPRDWRVTVTHNNANAITYSVGFCIVNL